MSIHEHQCNAWQMWCLDKATVCRTDVSLKWKWKMQTNNIVSVWTTRNVDQKSMQSKFIVFVVHVDDNIDMNIILCNLSSKNELSVAFECRWSNRFCVILIHVLQYKTKQAIELCFSASHSMILSYMYVELGVCVFCGGQTFTIFYLKYIQKMRGKRFNK